jgi:YfiH family protein
MLLKIILFLARFPTCSLRSELVLTGPDFLHSTLLAEYGITALFSLRTGGVSPAPFDSLNLGRNLGDSDSNIDANLNTLSEAIGFSSPPHQTKQVHGSKSIWCQGSGVIHNDEADILLTSQPRTPLAVRTADCLPILLADPKTGIATAVHAGWRGTVAQVAIAAVREMQSRGVEAKNILASLGPCIEPCCFIIDAATADKLSNSVPGAGQHIRRDTEIAADLREINALQLKQCSLTAAHIECLSACTACDNRRFFSYRRDGKRTGRHLAVVALPRKP